MDRAISDRKPFNQRLWLLGLAACTSIVLAGAGCSDLTTGTTAVKTEPVVDAPHLLTLTIEQARTELGAPKDVIVDPTEQQLALGTKEWSNEFTVNGYNVLLTYDVKSRDVNDFFITANDDPDRGTQDWQKYVQLSTLSEQSSDYTVKPIESLKDKGYYTGVEAKETN